VRETQSRISPFVEVVSYFNQWQRTIDLETLGLQEDFRMGPVARVRLYPAHRDLGSSRSLLGIRSLASYAEPIGTGYGKLELSHDVELGSVGETHALMAASLRFASPRHVLGRVIVDATFQNLYRNYYRSFYSLDNRGRLRGYRADLGGPELYGTGLVAANVELRSRPLSVLSTLIGLVAFYDVGDAFYDLDEVELRHGFGGGIRFLIPQLDRDVLRIDVGFPADRNDPLGEITVNASFRQAFSPP
jgi:hypothetical protein